MSIISRVIVAGACALLVVTSAAQARQAQATPAPATATLAGTYAGDLTPDDGTPGGTGVVVLKEKGDTLDVTLGESLEQLLPGTKVERKGDVLSFEVDVPGTEPNHLAFEVTVAGPSMTGKVTQIRNGQTRTAKVAFTRQ